MSNKQLLITMRKFLFTIIALAVLSIGFSSCEKEVDENQNGNEVLIVDNITSVTTWTADKVYVIDGSIDVEANITIEPGTIIKFKTGSSLGFGYTNNVTITANGTADKRIVFTAYSATATPGAWYGLTFYGHVLQNSSLTYCDFLYAGYSSYSALDIRCKLIFNNNLVKNAKEIGIDLNDSGSFVSMTGNTIENCGSHPIRLYPFALHTLGANNIISANSGYGILVENNEVTATDGANITWKKQTVPYIINGGITVETNLTIEPGTVLSFNAGGRIDFGYSATTKLTAIGTITNPIVFTSSNTSPATGAWKGIFLYQYVSSNTVLDYCTFQYAGFDQEACLYIRETSGITVKNCNFLNSSGWGIYLDNSATLSAASIDNTFTSCALGNIGTN